jgi:hypothetical protein
MGPGLEDFMNDLFAVVALFFCSLVAAYVTFAILRSTAKIQKKEYQVGGAAAGFLVIYAALYASYHQLQGASLSKYQEDNKAMAEKLKEQADELQDVIIQGTIDPPLSQAAVVPGLTPALSDPNGRFYLTTKGHPTSLYVIKEEKIIPLTIFPGDDLKNVKIPNVKIP